MPRHPVPFSLTRGSVPTDEIEAGAGELAQCGIRQECAREAGGDAGEVALLPIEEIHPLVARVELLLEAVQSLEAVDRFESCGQADAS